MSDYLLRRLDRENPQETHLQAHNALENYWQEQNDPIEVIYHLNCVDWERGIDNWVEVFDEALRLSQYDVCRSLLTIRSELTVGSDFSLGYISQSEGKYFAQLSLYDAAQKEFTEAIEAYETALTLAPEDIPALNNKGNTLQSLGELEVQLSNHQQAIISYQQAIESYDRVLSLAPEYILALNNKGEALQNLGELQVQLSNHSQAIISYEQAIESYDRALSLAPEYILALNNKGAALINLGSILQEEKQKECFVSCLDSFSRSLAIAPNNSNIRNLHDELSTFLRDSE